MSQITADKLTVTFDHDPKGLDVPCLVVSRKLADGAVEIINAIKGEAAVDMYNALTSWVVIDNKE